jgi:hypothetical protein
MIIRQLHRQRPKLVWNPSSRLTGPTPTLKAIPPTCQRCRNVVMPSSNHGRPPKFGKQPRYRSCKTHSGRLAGRTRQSMSRPDNCYDNAFMESFFGTFKNELEMTEYQNIQEALKEVAEYIRYYNFERRHSALDYRSPAQFEQLIQSRK